MSLPRLHALSTGSMTSALSGFLGGEQGDITFPVLVFVIEHSEGLVLVDTGLHPELATDSSRLGRLASRFKVDMSPDGSGSVGPVLQRAGFDPTQVQHLVMTHLHFDHSGGICEVPNARVTIQRDEWAGLKNEVRMEREGFSREEVDLGHDRLEVDGDHDLFGDGTITCLKTPGHTAGHQSIRVRTEAGIFVLCGDCCYLRRSLDDEHLPGFSVDADQQLRSIRRLKREQADGATMIFGHDPEQWATITAEGLHQGV